jgi:isopenicillin N synthase-like dioxygenase
MTQVGIRLLRAFAEALQLPENAFDGSTARNPTSISN